MADPTIPDLENTLRTLKDRISTVESHISAEVEEFRQKRQAEVDKMKQQERDLEQTLARIKEQDRMVDTTGNS